MCVCMCNLELLWWCVSVVVGVVVARGGGKVWPTATLFVMVEIASWRKRGTITFILSLYLSLFLFAFFVFVVVVFFFVVVSTTWKLLSNKGEREREREKGRKNIFNDDFHVGRYLSLFQLFSCTFANCQGNQHVLSNNQNILTTWQQIWCLIKLHKKNLNNLAIVCMLLSCYLIKNTFQTKETKKTSTNVWNN